MLKSKFPFGYFLVKSITDRFLKKIFFFKLKQYLSEDRKG